jgi:hypothetical protein
MEMDTAARLAKHLMQGRDRIVPANSLFFAGEALGLQG